MDNENLEETLTNNELINKFFNLEKKYDLFNLSIENEVYWWDIVRYHVYLDLLLEKSRLTSTKQKKGKKNNIFKIILFLLNDCICLVINKFKKIDFVFFTYPRNIDKNGNSIDNIANDTLSFLKKKSFVVDTLRTGKCSGLTYNNIGLFVLRKIYSLKKRRILLNIDINEILNREFNTNINFDDKIYKLILNYQADLRYYKKMFSIYQPKMIFFLATGNEKGLIAAANKMGIKTTELQHAQANRYHAYYSYPFKIEYSHLATLPTAFLTFSDHWNKVNYPVKKKLSIGNSLYKDMSKPSINKDVAVISAGIYMENILYLIKRLAIKIPERNIILKLHPAQNGELPIIVEELKEYKNIKIIFNEKTVSAIFHEVSSVIIIQSTTVYEALQVGLKVFLYKKQDFDSHDDIFNNKNVYLINNEDEIIKNLDNPLKEDDVVFFKNFDVEVFKSFLCDEIYKEKGVKN